MEIIENIQATSLVIFLLTVYIAKLDYETTKFDLALWGGLTLVTTISTLVITTLLRIWL